MTKRSALVLADGTFFPGYSLGAEGITQGELVFTTGMTGYEEVLTDPSFAGQLVTMTATQIGNTGINLTDGEAERPRLNGFIVREPSPCVSNWRATESLDAYLARHGIVAIAGIDTRALTKHIRMFGAQNAVIAPFPESSEMAKQRLVRMANEVPSMLGLDLASRVSTKEPYRWTQGLLEWGSSQADCTSDVRSPAKKVVVVDYGVKRNILRSLVELSCEVIVVPAHWNVAQILEQNPDGILLSNGPGDPAVLHHAIETIRSLLGRVPLFGICLGHQLLSLAMGARTSKLPFGHRGMNQPVRDCITGRIEITTQNHGFVVEEDSLPQEARVTHVHLNDGSCEGICHRSLPAFAVQYHPEAAAGPHDSLHLFSQFMMLMERGSCHTQN